MKNFIQYTFIALILTACESSTTTPLPASGCVTTGSNRTALIQVLDGILIRACGCNESNGAVFPSGQVLTCTINRGTTLFFNFTSTQVSHQMTIPAVFTTPIIAPNQSGDRQPIFPIKLETAGTFNFYDIFFPSVGGNLIVL